MTLHFRCGAAAVSVFDARQTSDYEQSEEFGFAGLHDSAVKSFIRISTKASAWRPNVKEMEETPQSRPDSSPAGYEGRYLHPGGTA